MAKKEKNKEAATASPLPRLKWSVSDERQRILLGLFTLLFAFLLCISFFSFFFTWDQDQSQLEIPFFEFMFNSDIQVDNWGAKVGAIFAKFFIHSTFGVAAFAVPFLLVLLGFRFLKIRLLPLRTSLKYAALWTIVTSLFLGLVFGDIWDANLGGAHGYFVVRWLSSVIGFVPAGFIVLLIAFGATVYTFPGTMDYIRANFPLAKGANALADTKLNNPEDTLTDEALAAAAMAQDLDIDEVVLDEEIFADDLDAAPEEADTVFDADAQKAARNGEPEFSFERPEPEAAEVFAGFTPPLEDEDPDELAFDIVNKDLELEMADEITGIPMGDYDPKAELSHYSLPPVELLEDYTTNHGRVTEAELVENKNKIVETLLNYKIQIDKIKATIGPTVTLYEIVPAPGVRISKIKNLEDDIALSLAALGIRIIAPIPGKGTIGIEVPNQYPEVVSMRSIISSKSFQETTYDLPLALGKTISNETFLADLTKMPHLLIAGATGQGKSVGLNAILASLLYKKHPSQLKFVLVDPKKVELTLYQKIENHYLAKLPDEEEAIITDTQKVVNTLNSLCIEMDQRYDLLKAAQQRNLKEYNAKFIKRRLNPREGHRFLPYIVVVIDEFADLIMTAGKEVELPLARLAQLARAIGIHLVIATQRPTTNIITGVIKANFPSRIAFRVSSSMDSRTILDSPGANQLIGKGDMLISQGSDMIRVQCAFVDTPELERITDFISKQQSYGSPMLLPEYNNGEGGDNGPLDVDLGKRDSLFDEAARLLVIHQQGSTSLIQRKFSIGYNRAGRIVDQMEAAGIVGPFEGSKARAVLISDETTLEQLLRGLPH